jgi:glutamate racemase
MRNLPIGVFDSGIGGLTVVKSILKELPKESIIYLGDTARVPYGTRDNDTIKKFSVELTKFMINKNVKAIVVACNTMSAVALDEIRRTAGKIPVIDVITPTIEEAIRLKGTSVLGVIGTRATAHSRAFQAQIARHGKHYKVIQTACPLFVPLVEEGLVNGKVTELVAKDYLEEINKSNADVLILACTHYPMLSKVIRKVLRRTLKIIDCASPTAKYLKELLNDQNLLNLNKSSPELKFYVTDNPDRSFEIANIFFDGKFPGKIEKISL